MSTQFSCKSVLILGMKNVGKTTILHQLRQISSKGVTNDSKRRKSVQCTHIKAQEQLHFSEATQYPCSVLKTMAIKSAEAFVLAYAVDDEESFDYVTTLLGQIITIKGYDVPLVVVGNKIDIEHRKVHPIIADCVVTIDYECKHKEISAVSGEGIQDVLTCLLGSFGEQLRLTDEDECRSSITQSIKRKLTSFFRK